MAHRKVSAQTRVKLSQAAKKRRRGLKGTPLAGKFLDGIYATGIRSPAPYPISNGARKRQKKAAKKYAQRQQVKEVIEQREKHYDAQGAISGEGKASRSKPKGGELPDRFKSAERMRDETALQMARAEVRQRHQEARYNPNAQRRLEDEQTLARASRMLGKDPSEVEVGRVRTKITSTDVKEIDRMLREDSWATRPVYARGADKRISTSKFIKTEMPESHRRWLLTELQDPASVFNRGLAPGKSKRAHVQTPAAGHRLDVYIKQLQEGASHAEAIQYLQSERRGAAPAGTGAARKKSSRDTAAKQLLAERDSARGQRSRTQSFVPSASRMQQGIETPRVSSPEEIKRRFPGLTEKEYLGIQQAQRRYIFDEMLENNRWTHETKRANYLKEDSEGHYDPKHGPDRVVFFTTNLGTGPAPSVPADSLVGQYIIKRRKKMLRDDKLATPNELRGRFPEAVRDRHIVEVGTGIALGAQGRYGVWSKGGWRAGAKKSAGFGKSKPVGGSILYDNQGNPMYDDQGNIRYTEGGTRPFNVGLEKGVGLRVFIG